MDEPVSDSPAFSHTGLHGQTNLDAGVTGPGQEADISFVVTGDYAAGDVQTQTGALSDILGCEKGLENVRLHLFGNTRTVIGDLHKQPAWPLRCAYPDAARSIHRVDSVVYQVRPHVVKLAAVRVYGWQTFVVLTDQDDFGAFQLVREHDQRLGSDMQTLTTSELMFRALLTKDGAQRLVLTRT
jgi:hypothetical protein